MAILFFAGFCDLVVDRLFYKPVIFGTFIAPETELFLGHRVQLGMAETAFNEVDVIERCAQSRSFPSSSS
jgi:hypothetical protein